MFVKGEFWRETILSGQKCTKKVEWMPMQNVNVTVSRPNIQTVINSVSGWNMFDNFNSSKYVRRSMETVQVASMSNIQLFNTESESDMRSCCMVSKDSIFEFKSYHAFIHFTIFINKFHRSSALHSLRIGWFDCLSSYAADASRNIWFIGLIKTIFEDICQKFNQYFP